MNYYPHHIGDYLRDTAHLSALEDGVYRRMLDLYYASEKPLPIDFDWLTRLVRATTDCEREAVNFVLTHFFEKREDGWHNKRADQEIRIAIRKAKAARNNGKKGGRPKTQRVISGLAEENLNVTQAKAPKTNNQTQNQSNKAISAFALPAWVSREAWEAFEDSRKKLRKPMTDRARVLVIAELERLRASGHEPAAVLNQSVRKGWLDVFPLKDAPRNESVERI